MLRADMSAMRLLATVSIHPQVALRELRRLVPPAPWLAVVVLLVTAFGLYGVAHYRWLPRVAELESRRAQLTGEIERLKTSIDANGRKTYQSLFPSDEEIGRLPVTLWSWAQESGVALLEARFGAPTVSEHVVSTSVHVRLRSSYPKTVDFVRLVLDQTPNVGLRSIQIERMSDDSGAVNATLEFVAYFSTARQLQNAGISAAR